MTLVIDSGFNYDTDASAYIDAVEAADGQALETATRYAINNFVIGCKQDGIWSAIKASCILAGARTLAGALMPLAGAAPSNVGPFTSGDYDRKLGLERNSSGKYLNSNRAQNADPQNNHHLSIYKSNSVSEDAYYIGSGSTSGQGNYTLVGRDLMYSRINSTGIPGSGSTASSPAGLWGVSRTSSTTVQYKRGSTTAVAATTVASLANDVSINHFVGTFNAGGSADNRGTAKFAFYSIGESLDLTLLDARVVTLITAIGAAIP